MKTFKFLTLCLVAYMLVGCSASKRVVYMQDIENNQTVRMSEEKLIRIKPLDRLTVVVTSKDPELAAPFNATSSYNSLSSMPNATSTVSSRQSLQVRTVDEKGNLYIPIIGDVPCLGKTRSEVAETIAKEIKDGGYIADASVNVEFADMKVYVMGEVARPGQYDIVRDQITLLEALAMAGDMTIYGNRSSVAVIRKIEGKSKTFIVNLLSVDAFSSPAFYLQQGDIIYVQPNRYKSANAEINQNRTFWISIVSTLVAVASLIATLTK